MRLDDEQESSHIESQRGSGGGGFQLGGMGGGGGPLGLIFGLVASRFGILGIIGIALVMWLLGGNPASMLGGGSPQAVQPSASGDSAIQNETDRTVAKVLGSTERRWTDLFAAQGQKYPPPTLVFYDRNGMSGCGAAQSAMGPFYCPADQKIYLDTTFFDELASRFGAPGDFGMAYVIAHEVGHHVQTVTGISDKVRAAQQRANEAGANALQVKMELQADCYAGVWAANDKNLLEPGDVEEGMRAAEAIGDDTLQKAAGQRPVPESFTHGTSAQRMEWLRRGLQTGDPAQCDTFAS
ncbi:flagellar biosynthesis protein FlgM [Sphingomonas sp. DBB INV C78]|uniref:KPN_02809 family neutral zinc metallopeptidase n=1 Tax=Sphingomonas sp. DBB INV C78 TaxID=3349434 RepID=UPI0036D2BA0A